MAQMRNLGKIGILSWYSPCCVRWTSRSEKTRRDFLKSRQAYQGSGYRSPLNVDTIYTDNRSEFDNEILTRLLGDYNVHHIKISRYNSRAQGIVERSHRTLRGALYRSCWPNPELWPKKFHQALRAERITIRPTAGYSSYYLVNRHEPLLLCDAFVLTFAYAAKPMSHEELLASRIQLLDRKSVNEAIAYQNATQSRFKAARKWNLEHQCTMLEEDHQPGTFVIVRNKVDFRNFERGEEVL